MTDYMQKAREAAAKLSPTLPHAANVMLGNLDDNEAVQSFARTLEALDTERAAHEATKAELQAITIALHDAIRRPMGVVPASADQFYNPVLAAQAEIRRIEKDAN